MTQEDLGRTNRQPTSQCSLSDATIIKKTSLCTGNEINKIIQFGIVHRSDL
jgi:hypothetical protein